MRAYYNEIDPYCVLWLRNLIAAGHIASGDVDERPIEHLTPADLKGYTQCHFFAGLGGWSRALRLAGWADERPVWTGSCPCQPYSAAGKGLGESDARNLWPVWHALIGQCRPGVVIGEQVDSAIRFGWIDGVRADLEAQDYAAWHTVLPAACAGAPQIRHRLWWVAVAEYAVGRPEHETRGTRSGRNGLGRSRAVGAGKRGVSGVAVAGGVAVADGGNACDGDEQRGREQRFFAQDGGTGERVSGRVEAPNGSDAQGRPTALRDVERILDANERTVAFASNSGRLGESNSHRCLTRQSSTTTDRHGHSIESAGDARGLVQPQHARQQIGKHGRGIRGHAEATERPGPLSFWSAYDLIPCADGKARRVEPKSFPLAHGFPRTGGRMRAVLEGMGLDPRSVKRALRNARSLLAKAGRNRVGRLRAYGNAIEPQTAARFIELFKDVIPIREDS